MSEVCTDAVEYAYFGRKNDVFVVKYVRSVHENQESCTLRRKE